MLPQTHCATAFLPSAERYLTIYMVVFSGVATENHHCDRLFQTTADYGETKNMLLCDLRYLQNLLGHHNCEPSPDGLPPAASAVRNQQRQRAVEPVALGWHQAAALTVRGKVDQRSADAVERTPGAAWRYYDDTRPQQAGIIVNP